MKLVLEVCLVSVLLQAALAGPHQRVHSRAGSSVYSAESQETSLSQKDANPLLQNSMEHNTKMTLSDTCYQVPERNSPTRLLKDKKSPAVVVPLRGVEKSLKTLALLEAAAAKDGKKWQDLKLPNSLQKVLKAKHEDKRSHRHLLPREVQDEPSICPSPEEMAPCTCQARTINCSATGNFTRIREIFNTAYFTDTSFDSFNLYGTTATVIESETILLKDTFYPVSFKHITIETSHLHVVDDDAFKGSEYTLHTITMQHNFLLHTFPFSSLYRLFQLKTLQLGYCQLQTVSALLTMGNLETLELNFNSITYIEPYAFAHLPMLTTIDLGHNELEIMQANDFAFSSPDVVLYLDTNKISNIEDDAFSQEQPSLLDIYSNQMTTLNVTVFKPILDNIIEKEYESYVSAEENPLCCQYIQWIVENPVYNELIALPFIDCYYNHV